MNTIKRINGAVLAAILLTGLAATGAHAQGPDGGPPPMGMGGPMGRGMGGPPPQRISEATIPISVLTTELSLSSEQQTKITMIQQTFQDARRELTPPPPRPDDSTGQDAGPPPMPPQPDAATREKVRTLETNASKQIDDVLTDGQKTTLASLVQILRALQSAGVAPRNYEKLSLTSDQKTQILSAADSQRAQDKAAIAKASGDPDALQSVLGDSRRKLHDAVTAILTDTQKRLARAGRPGGPGGQRQGRGPDGQGGPPQDGNGPPPPGGPGGPDGNGPPMDGQGGPRPRRQLGHRPSHTRHFQCLTGQPLNQT